MIQENLLLLKDRLELCFLHFRLPLFLWRYSLRFQGFFLLARCSVLVCLRFAFLDCSVVCRSWSFLSWLPLLLYWRCLG